MPIFERMMYITEAGDRRNNDTDYEEGRYVSGFRRSNEENRREIWN